MTKIPPLIATLNTLIETSMDGERGFHRAASLSKSPDLRALLETFAADCATAVSELQACVRALGGDPENTGTVAGAVHRGWMALKTGTTFDDDKALLQECERGEDIAKAIYADALEQPMPMNIQQLVQVQYEGTLQHHERIRDLRDLHEATAG